MTPEEIAEARVDLINAKKLLETPGIWTKDLEARNKGCMCILDAIGWAALGQESRDTHIYEDGPFLAYNKLRNIPAINLLYASSNGDFNDLEDLYGLNDRSETDLEMIIDVLDTAINYSETLQ